MQQGPSSPPESQANLATGAGRFAPAIRRAGDFRGVVTSYRNPARPTP